MPRVSVKEDKNAYFKRRDELHLTREKASELLGAERIPPERIEKIENERVTPRPDEVLLMAEKYKKPELCNFYCAHQCDIGKQYVPEIKVQDLSRIVLEMVASMNSAHRGQERLIEIAADGEIKDEEVEDFVRIQQELERISITVEALQFWSEQMLANGSINREKYEECKSRLSD